MNENILDDKEDRLINPNNTLLFGLGDVGNMNTRDNAINDDNGLSYKINKKNDNDVYGPVVNNAVAQDKEDIGYNKPYIVANMSGAIPATGNITYWHKGDIVEHDDRYGKSYKVDNVTAYNDEALENNPGVLNETLSSNDNTIKQDDVNNSSDSSQDDYIKNVNLYLEEHPELESFEAAEEAFKRFESSVDSYLNNHPYLSRESAREVLKDYNSYVDDYNYDTKDSYLETFTFNNVGRLATGIDSSTALFEYANQYYGDYDKLHEFVKDENWKEKADKMLEDANSIIDYFGEFEDYFNEIDGETGKSLSQSLELCMDDFIELKTYISENVKAATDQVDRLEEILKYRDELNTELESKTMERDNLLACEPSKTVPCSHYHTDSKGYGYYEHQEGDENPEHVIWEENVKKLDMRIVELKKSITIAEYQASMSLGKIKTYNAVVIKFKDGNTWNRIN